MTGRGDSTGYDESVDNSEDDSLSGDSRLAGAVSVDVVNVVSDVDKP